ncbi:MAG: FG-GAP repeat domain-containing protein [Phycisphaerales bacterium]
MLIERVTARCTSLLGVIGLSTTMAAGQFAGFGPRTDYALGEMRPAGSVSGDLDGDGDIDLAFSFQVNLSGALGRVGVVFNNGDGTFGSPTFYGVGENPLRMAIADVDLDGDLDLITVNQGTSDVSVLRNMGNGSYFPEVFFGVGDGPQDLAVADVNADGQPDIVTANEADETVSVVAGDGSGTTWSVIGTYTTNNNGGTGGASPSSVAISDLNADGFPDIVTANSGSATCTIMYNIAGSPGSFFAGDFALFASVGSNPQDLALADIDRDGDIDIITANRTSGTVTTRLSNRVQSGVTFPSFSGGVSVAVPAAPIGLALADIDSPSAALDGDLDILVACENADRMAVLINNGSGGLTLDSTYITLDSPRPVTVGDYDGDGDPDAAVGSLSADSFSIFFNDSTVIGGPPPIVEIASPGDGACLCEGSNTITGTVNPAPGTQVGSYLLEYRRLGTDAFTTIATGSSAVVSGTLASWNTTGLAEGQYLLRLTGSNTGGISATDEAVVFLGNDFDTVSARFGAGIDGSAVSIVGRRVCIFGSIGDGGCGVSSYMVDYRPISGGSFIPVDPAFPSYSGGRTNTTLATWDTVALGVPDGMYQVRVRAFNPCGDSAEVFITGEVDNTAPIARIDTPVACVYRSPGETIEIKGTASDLNLGGWSLQYTGGSNSGWTTIASGNTSVTDDVLANWDTTGLEPCAYTVRLSVNDRSVLNCDDPGNGAGYLVSFDLRCPADLTGDNVLDFFDVSAFLSAYNMGCP